ncbi:MAG: hypothetical protein IJQ85_04995 [Selenomonadaceae bacterium]|nr:hypothetical protein [Selenomonadaceae bacterium]
MTEQEKFNVEIKTKLALQDEKFNSFMQELKEQREDMRRLWERQDAMQAKHDAEMKSLQEKQNAEMKEMNQRFYQKFDDMDKKIDDNAKEFTKQLHSNFVQTMIGVGAIMAAIGGLIITTLK